MVSSVLLAGGPFVLRGEWSNTRTMATLFLEAASLTTAVTYIVKDTKPIVRPQLEPPNRRLMKEALANELQVFRERCREAHGLRSLMRGSEE